MKSENPDATTALHAGIPETVNVSESELRAIGEAALRRIGVPADNARTQVSLLVSAELRGRASHGILRLPRLVRRILNGVIDPVATGSWQWNGNILTVDGQRGLGPVVGLAALEALAEKVGTSGLAMAAISNSNHIGMLAWYAEFAARQGYILIGITTSEALVHPWGGRKAMIGTNPITIGVPTSGLPFVIDMATSVTSMGQIHDHAARGVPIPKGWALDASGEPTTVAAMAKDGSIAPFGGAKGYALGLALEVLVTALTSSAIGRDVVGTLDDDKVCNKGDVLILIKPSADAGIGARIAEYLDEIRNSANGQPVLVPNDRATMAAEISKKQGVSIPAALWMELRQLAGEGVRQ